MILGFTPLCLGSVSPEVQPKNAEVLIEKADRPMQGLKIKVKSFKPRMFAADRLEHSMKRKRRCSCLCEKFRGRATPTVSKGNE